MTAPKCLRFRCTEHAPFCPWQRCSSSHGACHAASSKLTHSAHLNLKRFGYIILNNKNQLNTKYSTDLPAHIVPDITLFGIRNLRPHSGAYSDREHHTYLGRHFRYHQWMLRHRLRLWVAPYQKGC